MRLFLVVSVIFFQNVVFGARILCVYPIASISHQIVYRALTQELAKRGHELVVITTDPYLPKNRPVDNVREIDVGDISYSIYKKAISGLSKSTRPPIVDFFNIILKGCLEVFDAQLESPEIKDLIHNYTEEFDLLIVESVFRPAYFFTHRFKAPVIGISSLMGSLHNYDAMGTPNDPVIYPDFFQHKIENLSVWDKFEAIYFNWYQRYASWRIAKEENRVGKKHFGENTPDVQELSKNMDLLLLNVNHVWDGVRPLPPSVIYVGGLHIQPVKELPKELKSYLDDCSRGVVYMSLGSNIKSSELAANKREIFLQVFGELPYCIIWKWETENLPGKPDNVRISKWLPQADLLGHPNVLAFITQGGLQSTDEAIDREVPVIGVPFIVDQMRNVQKYVHHGIGIALQIQDLNADNLRNAIINVTRDESYKKNIRQLKSLMYDQPTSALDRAAWWVEYLLRHGNARHLRSPLADQQLNYWPLVALLVAAISVLIHSINFIRMLSKRIISINNSIKIKID